MAYDKDEERKIIFKRIGKSIEDMWDTIDNCNTILNKLGFRTIELPNIIISYGEKYLEIAEQFENAGVDFYAQQCESRYIIENKLQSQILIGKHEISRFLTSIKIAKIQMENYRKMYLKPAICVEGEKTQEYRNYILEMPQLIESKQHLEDYKKANEYIKKFDIQEEIIGAILYYRGLALTNGVLNFDDRIDKLDEELIKLGYEKTKEIFYEEIEKQPTGIKTINDIKSKHLKKSNELLEER